MPPSPRSACSRCGAPLGADTTAGICPPCEFAAAIAPLQAPPISESPDDPRRFGDYEILEEIAHGGMGVVYRARHVKLNRVVALKMLLLGQFASDQAIQRFQREAAAAAGLRHPGIVSVHEVGEVDGQHYFTMELVEGRSLASLLQSGPLPARSAAVYLQAITEAVAHAHDHGIVHRDLKPSNILIDLFDAPRITDFGLARRLDGTSDITLTGHIVGSPNYLAPEILSGRSALPSSRGQAPNDQGTLPGPPDVTAVSSTEPAPTDSTSRRGPDPRSPLADIFSLGAVLYECLTGRPPFLGATLEETLLRVRDSEPVSPRVLGPRIPRDLETICLKCLEKDPTRRYPGAQELASELRRFLEGHPIQARPITPLGKAWRWAPRKPALAAMAVALHLVLLAGLSGILWQWSRAESEAGRANRIAAEARNNLVRQFVAQGNDLAGQRRPLESLPWFLAALENEPDAEHLEAHRIRLSTALRQSPRLERVWSHAKPIIHLALNPTERWIASASEDHTARVWDLDTGQPITPPLPHDEAVQGVRFHPKGQLLLTFSSQREHRPTFGSKAVRGRGSVRLWSLPEGREVWHSLHTNIVPQAEFNPEGSRILAACADGHARVWRVEPEADTARVLLEFELEHPSEVRAASFSPSGDQIATGARDGHYRVWDTATRRLVHDFDNFQGDSDFAFFARRWEVVFSPDGRHLLGGHDYRARMWSLDSEANPIDLALGGMMNSLQLSRDGRSIVIADMSGSVGVWASDTGTRTAEIRTRDHDDALAEDLAAVFTPDASRIALWNYDGVQCRNSRSTFPSTPRIPTRLVTYARPFSDGRRFLVGTATGQIQVWNLAHPETTSRTLELGTTGTRVRFSADGRRLATGNWSSQVGFWDTASGHSHLAQSHHQRAATYGIQGLEPSVDGKLVLATDWGGTARVYDFATGTPASALWTNTLGIPSVGTFLPDGRHVATADRAGVLRIHRLPDGTCLRSVTNAEAMPFQQVLATPDGSLLYTVSNDGLGRRWDTATLEPRGTPFKLGGVTREARWSPDRRRIVTTTVTAAGPRVWEAATGNLLQELPHPVMTDRADFSPDGRWIGTASVDGTVRLWDGQTGAVEHEFRGGTKPLDIRFSPDGRWLAVGGIFGVRAWEVTTGEAITPLLEVDPGEVFANGIAFSPDSLQLAGTGGGSVARIWDLRPAPYSLEQWQRLIPALTGQRVDKLGELKALSNAEAAAVRAAARREFPAEFAVSNLLFE